MAITSATLTAEQVGDHLRAALEDDVLEVVDTYGTARVTVRAEALPRAARLCKSEPRLGFDFFDFLSAVDEREQGFAVIVSLYSLAHRHHVTLRTLADGGRDAPRVPSLTGVYRGANWHERETYDMYGITFDGHPSLLPRILTVENFEGWPLRKDFLLATREAKPWPGAKEPEERREEAGQGQSEAVVANASPMSAAEKEAAVQAKVGAAEVRADARDEVDYDQALYEQLLGEGKSERIARSRAKAAAMRARKKSAEAAAQDAPGGETPAAPGGEVPAAGGDLPAAGGEAEGAAAAAERTAEGDPVPSSPEGAAAVAELDMADPSIAYDAAAGAVGGDVAAGAPGDVAGADQPVSDLAAEARVGTGAPPTASGTPGIEAEGRHGGAEEQSGERPAADTRGMGSVPGGAIIPPDDRPAARGSSRIGEGQVVGPAPGSEEATLFDDLSPASQAAPGGAAEAGEVTETPLVDADGVEPAPAPGTDASERGGPLYGATGSAHEDDDVEEGTTP